MTILELSEVAKEYYESTRTKTLYSGYERNVLTDGKRCLFVKGDYLPNDNEAIFRCMTINKQTRIELKKKGDNL